MTVCVLWGLSLAAYFAVDPETVADSSVVLWTFRVLILGGALIALLVAPAVLIARVFTRAWRELGLPPRRT